MSEPRRRVISLVPSSTETLLTLGVDVVACTKFCEQPSIRHVGGTKNPDVDTIIALAPDLVVLDREENRIEDHDALVAAGLTVFVSDVRSVADAARVVGELADASGVAVAPVAVPSRMSDRGRRRAFVPIWRRPWMTITANTYGGSVLDLLGVDLVGPADGAAYPTLELADVAAAQPDLVIVPSEPYEFTDRHVSELRRELPKTAIVRVDGQDLFWWGIRTSGAISRLERALELPPMA